MQEPIYTEVYKNHIIEIIPDYDAESPERWDDGAVFLVGFHRDFTVEHEGMDQETVSNALRLKLHGKISAVDEDYKESARELNKKYHIFPLAAYIHSGVRLSLGRDQFRGRLPQGHYEFDTCTLGAVFVEKSEVRNRSKAEKNAAGLVDTWNDYLAGNVYGYRVRHEGEDDDIESVWGFYGDFMGITTIPAYCSKPVRL